ARGLRARAHPQGSRARRRQQDARRGDPRDLASHAPYQAEQLARKGLPPAARVATPSARHDAHLARASLGIAFALQPASGSHGGEGMDMAEKLERELEETTARLRHDVNLAVLDEGAFAVADSRGIVDEVDGAQRSVEREMTLATRSRLRQRAQRLAG